MKVFPKVLAVAVFVGAAILVPASSGAEALGAMRVRLAEGDVAVKPAGIEEWGPVSVNMPLVEGDELWVPEGSRAAVQTDDGAYVRLDGNTALHVLRMDRNSFQFYLAQGRAYVLTRQSSRGVLQFDTPDASVRSFGSASFGIDIPEGGTDVSVFDGSVVAETEAGTTRVHAGSMLVLEPGGYAELSPLPPPDAWRGWNEQRNRFVLAQGESYRRLPDELRVYTSDFDDYGRWVYVSGYGYCWTPTVVASVGFAPYRNGRWVFRGGTYVWIGYEPWGWAPYHYGRWTHVARIGWCWVPPARGDAFWAPGYVAWVHTGDYVAWVPLAPREIYYAHGNYGRYSVNVTNVNISQIRITNVYRNVQVVNGVTVVNRTTFLTGRRSPVNRNVLATVRKDFTQHRGIVLGRPDIKPVERSHFPVARSIPVAKRPPATLRKVDAGEMRRSRPLVREPDRSALRPQAQPRPLPVRRVETPAKRTERPVERRHVSPPEGREVAPPEQRKASPPERRQVSPPEQRKSSPPAQREVAPQGRRQVTPPERRQVSPPEQRKSSPPAQREVAPQERRQVTPPERPGANVDREVGKGVPKQAPAEKRPKPAQERETTRGEERGDKVKRNVPEERGAPEPKSDNSETRGERGRSERR